MDEQSRSSSSEIQNRSAAKRFLWFFAISVMVIALIVASVNLVSYRYMLRPENQDIVQLLSGWGRMYKPILYDELKPDVVIYGASWARDAFDPIETGSLLGMIVFNHAVSGSTPYETRRFGDSSVDNANLKVAIINLDTFYRDGLRARFRYGFDESILDIDPDQKPNRWVGLRRTYSLTLTGWAAGANLKFLRTIGDRAGGAARPDYLESYERGDLTRLQNVINKARKRIFPDPGSAPGPSSRNADAAFPPGTIISEELEKMVDQFCRHGIDVYAYFTPHHMRKKEFDPLVRKELLTLEFLQRKQAACKSKISYFDFDYPNAVTLEGALTPVTASQYYRPDGHPRPTVGLLMAARMFGHAFPPGTPAIIEQDFAVDLLDYPDPEGWLRERGARYEGDWGAKGYADYASALANQ